MNNENKSSFVKIAGTFIFIIFLSLLIKLGVINEYLAHVLTLAGISVIMALSLNLITGFTGQLALGHAGFMAIGAYTATFMIMQLNVPIFISIIIGGIVSGLVGIVIGYPTLRLKGDYLAIVTLGFGEIIRVIMVNLEKLTGGAAGLKGIPSFTENYDWQPMAKFLWVFLTLTVVVFILNNFINSSYGRAIISIREDEIASGSMGVNIFYYKMFSFTISAVIAGVGGGLYALVFGYLTPNMFNFLKSVDFLIIVVLGGMGSISGTVIAGLSLTYLQEMLRFLKDYRLVIYPLLLIVIMLFRPSGIMGTNELSIKLIKDRYNDLKKKIKNFKKKEGEK